MDINRRDLFRIVGASAIAAGARPLRARPASAPAAVDVAAVRAEFPRAARKLWLANAETHPYSVHTLAALERYGQYRALGRGDGREGFSADDQAELKQLFANLINASPDEIAFVQSTTDGENIVVAGLDLQRNGGNVVIDDLHFDASRYLYERLEQDAGVQLRVVPHRDWRIVPEDMEQAIDANTRLVSMALVSNINGYMHDAAAVSRIAHAHGAHVYADIIQGAGCTPIDVRAMGIDSCACSTYKWLMGAFGIGFLYVRQDLQGAVVKQTRYGLRQAQRGADGAYEPIETAVRYEGTTSIANLAGVAALEGLRQVARLGVDAIRAHASQLTDRLHRELPPLGYEAITPRDNPTPIVSFRTPNPDGTRARLDRVFGEPVVSIRRWQRTLASGESEDFGYMRIGVSVFNNDADLDEFIGALGAS